MSGRELVCLVVGCDQSTRARGMCLRHYARLRATGSAELREMTLPASLAELEWRPVVGFEGIYEVSNRGDVRSLNRIQDHKRIGKVERQGRLMTPTADGNGYLRVSLSRDGRTYRALVHRVVLESFVGPSPESYEACHNNGTRADNRLENLRWDSSKANADDSRKHGTNWQLAKQECPRGHAYGGENLVVERTGARKCRICKRASDARYYEKKRNERLTHD